MAACFAPILVSHVRLGVTRVRCNQCIGCRMTHASQWATRLMHEASRHEETSFLTLTYSDEHLPDPPSVSRREMQLFLKRLRKLLDPKRVRFFLCGEYGGQGNRPHYHVILFGHSFRSDRYPWQQVKGNVYYRSPTLEQAWPLGHATIGDVTRESAGYVARYSLKKAQAWGHAWQGNPLMRVNAQTGEVYTVHPEFIQMSTRPGIGFYWADKFRSDAYPSGFIIQDGQKVAVPRAYKRRYNAQSTKLLEADIFQAEQKAKEQAARQAANNTPERMAVREELLHLKAKQLVRNFG